MLPVDFDPGKTQAIDALLDRICSEQKVGLLWAIESGSRAWGFPSPDSDYDCRFIFVRRAEDYLSPWQRRDVIEIPLVDDLDVNGWELGKALRLLLKGNAVVIEWLSSPIVYGGISAFRDDLLALAARHTDRDRIGRHYLHLGERQRRTYFGDGKAVELKKIFYALRPAVALRWLRTQSGESVVPMHFPTLLAECDPPGEVARLATELIEKKSATRELGSAPLPAPIADFVDSEFAEAAEHFGTSRRPPTTEARRDAENTLPQMGSSLFECSGFGLMRP